MKPLPFYPQCDSKTDCSFEHSSAFGSVIISCLRQTTKREEKKCRCKQISDQSIRRNSKRQLVKN